MKEGLVVGTPDVAWENEDTDAASGAVIAPMQAFFVELKDAAQTKAEGTVTGADLKVVRFDPSMMQGRAGEGLFFLAYRYGQKSGLEADSGAGCIS